LLSMFSFFTSRRELYNVLGGGMIIFGVAFSLANYSSLSIDATLAKLHSNIFLELIIGLLLIVINLTLLCIKYNSH
jgi:vacuolar-type H+-ATPase subunit I/STV1